MKDSKIEALEQELARQDAALEAALAELAQLGDVEFAIPEELLEGIEQTCTVRAPAPCVAFGLRG